MCILQLCSWICTACLVHVAGKGCHSFHVWWFICSNLQKQWIILGRSSTNSKSFVRWYTWGASAKVFYINWDSCAAVCHFCCFQAELKVEHNRTLQVIKVNSCLHFSSHFLTYSKGFSLSMYQLFSFSVPALTFLWLNLLTNWKANDGFVIWLETD